MALDDSKSVDKAKEPVADLHRTESTGKGVPDKSGETELAKVANESPADKLLASLKPGDWSVKSAGIVTGRDAISMINLSPLDLSALTKLETNRSLADKASTTAVLDRHFGFDALPGTNFKNYGAPESHYFNGIPNAYFADPFKGANKIDKIDEMGFKVNGFNFGNLNSDQINWSGLMTASFATGKDLTFTDPGKFGISASESLTNAFYADTAQKAGNDGVSRSSAAVDDGGFFGKWENNIFSGIKAAWNKGVELGGKIVDAVEKGLGNASIAVMTDNGTERTIKVGDESIKQSNVDANGKHEHVEVKTIDGITFNQDGNIRTVKNDKEPDLVLKQDKITGKVEAFDHSGKEVAEFKNGGDATRFFSNAITQVVNLKPGEKLEDAYAKYAKEHPDALKEKPIMLMDGKGETLTVQPDGSTLRTHASGDAEMTYKHWIEKKEHDIEVRVTHGPDGKEHVVIGSKGGTEFYDQNSDQAKAIIANSRLKVDGANLMVNDDPSGHHDRADWHKLFNRPNHLHNCHDGDIDITPGATAGTVTVTDDKAKQVAVFTPNPQTGVSTETDYKIREDGNLDKTRVTTMDHGKFTIQGIDSETGNPKPNDVVTIDTNKNTVDAWNVLMTPESTNIKGPDGNEINVDSKTGDITAFDSSHKEIFSTHGNSYEEAHTHKGADSYTREEAEHATVEAVKTAAIVEGLANALLCSLNISAGEVSALESALEGAVGSLPPNAPIPQQVTDARTKLAALKNRLNTDNAVSQNTVALAGVDNGELKAFAREAGNLSPNEAALAALKRAGYQIAQDEPTPHIRSKHTGIDIA